MPDPGSDLTRTKSRLRTKELNIGHNSREKYIAEDFGSFLFHYFCFGTHFFAQVELQAERKRLRPEDPFEPGFLGLGNSAGIDTKTSGVGKQKWRKEQIIGRRKVVFAFTKKRNLMIAIPEQQVYCLGKVQHQEDLVDMMLMVPTYNEKVAVEVKHP